MHILLLVDLSLIVLAQDFWSNFIEIPKPPLQSIGAIPKCGDDGSYMCVPYFNCKASTNTVEENSLVDGSNLIKPKSSPELKCGRLLEVCCKKRNVHKPSPTLPPLVDLKWSATCGLQNETLLWAAEIFLASQKRAALCGGSLISPIAVLTAAHCVDKYKPNQLQVRAGVQVEQVIEIVIHEHYLNSTLYNDVALLILSSSFAKAADVGTICLPKTTNDFALDNCFVAGLNKSKSPIRTFLTRRACEKQLRIHLGGEFILDPSFICTSLEDEAGISRGNGGTSLVCNGPLGRYYQVGIVSWGLGDDKKESLEVYADVVQYRDWVTMKLQLIGYNALPYTAD